MLTWAGQMSADENDLVRLSHAWDRAMVTNDADAIGAFMADDWTIVGADGNVSDKASFLALVRSGALTHDEMTSTDLRVRLYGEAAVVMSSGVSAGSYRGQRFRDVERVSSFFVRHGDSWTCVLTHLSRLEPS